MVPVSIGVVLITIAVVAVMTTNSMWTHINDFFALVVALGVTGGCLYVGRLMKASYEVYYRDEYTPKLEEWRNKWLCLRCGTTFFPPAAP